MGVAFLHANGVVHRDLKPNNILLIENRALVGDFGIARDVFKTSKADTHTSDLVGSRDYIAPEQRENPRAATEQSDIYSLGVILYELLAGRLPSYIYDPIASIMPEWSFFDPIIRRMLARSPSERYASIPEVLRAIIMAWTKSRTHAPMNGICVLPYETLLFVKRWLKEWPQLSWGLTDRDYKLFQIEDHIAFFAYWVGHPYSRVLKVPIPSVDSFEAMGAEIEVLESQTDSEVVKCYRRMVDEFITAHKTAFLECGLTTG